LPNSVVAIVAGQVLVFLAAVLCLLVVASHALVRKYLILLPGIALVISPLTIAFSNWVLTETLAASSTLLVLAALVRSIRLGKLSVCLLAPALLFAVLIRWDQVTLIVAIAATGLQLHNIRAMIERTGIILLPLGIVIGLLVARAISVGLPALPELSDPGWLPQGVVSFWRATTLRQVNTSALQWNVWARRYSPIPSEFDYDAIPSWFDRTEVAEAIEKLGHVPNGQPLPDEIDREFRLLSEKFNSTAPYYSNIQVPLVRAWYLWISEDRPHNSGWKQPGNRNLELARTLYRCLLLIGSLVLLLYLRNQSFLRILSTAILSYVFSRTIFLTVLTAVEVRYLMPMMPALEFQVFFSLAFLLDKRLTNSAPFRDSRSWAPISRND
jgi:hypothetical protein